MDAEFVTIGHSRRPLDEFTAMLRGAQVAQLADVRSFPRSRNNPAYNIDTLPARLADVQIGYRHFGDLGGRRPRQPGIDPAVNALWRVAGFHNYADYALGDAFAGALDALIETACGRRVAIMCAEAVWWRCHRRIIADYLLLRGFGVHHLMAPGRSNPALPTPGAKRRPDGKLTYPAAA